ncbi:MAG TPA: ribosomal protein S18-alanine N-acetyltransferase [Polyangiaceae bacterium]|jgi:ribosomal-protein-alanine N-acetyltransferase
MIIEPVTPGDCDGVAALCELTGTELDPAAELAKGYASILVAREESASPEPLGFALAWTAADELHVIQLLTHPAYRRKGVGRGLMNALLECGRRRQARRILLEVRRSNRAAIALYQSLGFRSFGVRRRYYADTDEDAVEMVLSLDTELGV